MAATRQDLITTVLENVGVLAAGQSAAIEDRAVVDRRIDPKLAELGRREVFVGLSADALDPSVFLYVADVIAAACLTPFGITGTKAESLVTAATAAEAALRGMARQFDAGSATAGYFDIVQSVLETLGVIAAGQTASNKDRQVVAARITPMLADLQARDITTVRNIDLADPGMLPHFAAILVARCASLFGADVAAQAAFGQAAAGAEAALNAMMRQFDAGVATSGRFDVIQVALENLGAVAVGRTGSDKDRSIIAGRVSAVLADLRNREVISIASLEAADAGTLLPLSVVLTSACAMAWGLPGDVRKALRVEADLAEAQLRRQTRQLDTGAGTSGVFDVIQAALEALGVVSAGQSGSAKDRATVSARIQPLLWSLRGRDICGVTDVSELSSNLQSEFARLLAADCVFAFSDVPPARAALLKSEVPAAEQSLRYQSFVYDALPPVQVDPGAMQRRRWPTGLLAEEFFGAPIPPAETPAAPPSNLPLIIRVDGGREG